MTCDLHNATRFFFSVTKTIIIVSAPHCSYNNLYFIQIFGLRIWGISHSATGALVRHVVVVPHNPKGDQRG